MQIVEEADVPSDADRQLATLREQHAHEELAILQAGGFEGVFRAPTPAIWKRFKAEIGEPKTRGIAAQNLVVACLLWPDGDAMRAAQQRKAALFDVFSSSLVDLAGAGQEATVKK